jgi:hypothetical protein
VPCRRHSGDIVSVALRVAGVLVVNLEAFAADTFH